MCTFKFLGQNVCQENSGLTVLSHPGQAFSQNGVHGVLASYADILLARHALLPNERLLKRAAINVDQSQRTSKAGKCALCPLGKFARHAETNTMDDRVVFQRVSARGYSVHCGKKMDVFLNLPTEETNYPQLQLKWS